MVVFLLPSSQLYSSVFFSYLQWYVGNMVPINDTRMHIFILLFFFLERGRDELRIEVLLVME